MEKNSIFSAISKENPIRKLPLVEIMGQSRVLIENHGGVMGYSRERILVRVGYGCVSVCGCGLELLRMTREQLVIRGKIEGVSLHRREKP